MPAWDEIATARACQNPACRAIEDRSEDAGPAQEEAEPSVL